jgi:hypothetical protein
MMPVPMTASAPRTQSLNPAGAAYRPLEEQAAPLENATSLQGKTMASPPEQPATQIAKGAELAPPSVPDASADDAGNATDISALEGGESSVEFQAASGPTEPEPAQVIPPGAPG